VRWVGILVARQSLDASDPSRELRDFSANGKSSSFSPSAVGCGRAHQAHELREYDDIGGRERATHEPRLPRKLRLVALQLDMCVFCLGLDAFAGVDAIEEDWPYQTCRRPAASSAYG
jgi:hypothetical protein